jgi:hypothetical protein
MFCTTPPQQNRHTCSALIVFTSLFRFLIASFQVRRLEQNAGRHQGPLTRARHSAYAARRSEPSDRRFRPRRKKSLFVFDLCRTLAAHGLAARTPTITRAGAINLGNTK